MKNIDKDKLNRLKEAKGLTIRELSDQSGIPESSLSKIFAGLNDNPTIETLQKLATVLDCIVDDFLASEKDDYYSDKKTGKLAQEIYDNRDLRILMDASKDLSPDDIKAIIEVANRLKRTKY